MRLTIFTPTYNRRELLTRTYNSLCKQNSKDFEWLIVDDGSTDNTGDLVKKWIEDKIIDIKYYYKANGGKMRAHNMGVKLANAPLFLCVDSDDYLIETAVCDLLEVYDLCKGKTKDGKKVAGVVAHKGADSNKLLGTSDFPEGELSTLYDLYLRGFAGETTLMYETDMLRQFMFPEIDGEKYVPEDYIYDKIDSVCVLAILPKIITICEIVEAGYTDSVPRLKRENPRAWYLYYEQRARITPMSMLRIKYLGRYIIYAIRTKTPIWSNKEIDFVSKIIGFIMAALLKIIRKE